VPTVIRRVLAILGAAARESLVDRVPRLAAALSYYSIFSLVPLLLLVVAVAGFLLHDPTAIEELVAQVTDVAGPEVGDAIESILETVRAQRGGTLSVGIVLAAFAGSSILQQVRSVLGILFHVPEERRRTGAVGWILGRGVALASITVLALLVLVPLAAVGAIHWLITIVPDDLSVLRPVVRLGVPLASVSMLMVVVGASFQALTPVEIPWRSAVVGGISTALTGLTAAYLVGGYLTWAGGTGTLGALGGAAILLLFFYLMWIVYLFGAEVTKVYGDYLEHGDVLQPSLRDEAAAVRAAPPPAAGPSTPDPPSGAAALLLVGIAVGWVARSARRRGR
jgi:membrane protein